MKNYQESGHAYANDNHQYFEQSDATPEKNARLALDNYNENAEASDESGIPTENESDFIFGAKRYFQER